MVGCQNYGPLWGPLNTRCRITLRTQKGTIMLRTTHVLLPTLWSNRASVAVFSYVAGDSSEFRPRLPLGPGRGRRAPEEQQLRAGGQWPGSCAEEFFTERLYTYVYVYIHIHVYTIHVHIHIRWLGRILHGRAF